MKNETQKLTFSHEKAMPGNHTEKFEANELENRNHHASITQELGRSASCEWAEEYNVDNTSYNHTDAHYKLYVNDHLNYY